DACPRHTIADPPFLISLRSPPSSPSVLPFSFFFNDTAPTEIYTLSLHDALPIWRTRACSTTAKTRFRLLPSRVGAREMEEAETRSEEHTSELQSLTNLVCRLLLEKKKRPVSTRPRRSSEQRHARHCGIDRLLITR